MACEPRFFAHVRYSAMINFWAFARVSMDGGIRRPTAAFLSASFSNWQSLRAETQSSWRSGLPQPASAFCQREGASAGAELRLGTPRPLVFALACLPKVQSRE